MAKETKEALQAKLTSMQSRVKAMDALHATLRSTYDAEDDSVDDELQACLGEAAFGAASNVQLTLTFLRTVLPDSRWSLSRPADWSDVLKPNVRKKKPYEAWVTSGSFGTKGYVQAVADGSTEALALCMAIIGALSARERMQADELAEKIRRM